MNKLFSIQFQTMKTAIAAFIVIFNLVLFSPLIHKDAGGQVSAQTNTLLHPVWRTSTTNLNSIVDFSVSSSTTGGDTIFNLSNKMVEANNSDIYLEAINSSTGSVLYTRTIGGLANLPDYGSAIAYNAADNSLYITASLIDTALHGLDIIVMRLNPSNFATTWQRKINGSAAFSFDVAAEILIADEIYICGTIENSNQKDYLTAKLSKTNGTTIWQKTYDYSLSDIAATMIMNSTADSLIVCGLSEFEADSSHPFMIGYLTNSGDTFMTYRQTDADLDVRAVSKIVRMPNTTNGYVVVGQSNWASDSTGLDIWFGVIPNILAIDNGSGPPPSFDGNGLDDYAHDVYASPTDGTLTIVGAIGKTGGSNLTDGVLLTYAITDSSFTLINTEVVANPDPTKTTALHKIDYRNGKLVAGGIMQKASGQNDLLLVKQNASSYALDYTKTLPSQNIKRVSSLKINPSNEDEIFSTMIALNDSGLEVQSTIKIEQVSYSQPPLLDTAETIGNFAYYQNRGQLKYFNTTDSIATPILYNTFFGGTPTFIRKDGFSIALAINDTIAAPDSMQRIDFIFEKTLSSPQIYSTDSTKFYFNYTLGHCPDGINNVHGNPLLLEQKLFNNTEIYYSGNNKGMRMQAAYAASINPSFELKVEGTSSVSVIDSGFVISTINGDLFYRTLAYQYDTSGVTLLDSLNVTYSSGALHFYASDYNSVKPTIIQIDRGATAPTANPDHYNIAWSSYLGDYGDDALNDVTVDNNGNHYYVGTTQSLYFPLNTGVTIYDSTLTSLDSSDALIVKINSIMEPQWISIGGGDGTEILKSIKVDTDGNVYTVGSEQSLDLPLRTPPGAYTQPINVHSLFKGLIMKLDSNGHSVWVTPFRDFSIADLALDNYNNMYVTSGGSYPMHKFSTYGIYDTDTIEYIQVQDGEFEFPTPVFNALAYENNALYAVGYGLSAHLRDETPPDTTDPGFHYQTKFYAIYYKIEQGDISDMYNFYYAGNGNDLTSYSQFTDVAVNKQGKVYAIGRTTLAEIPLQPFSSPTNPDEFIDSTKTEGVLFRFNQDLSTTEYCTYLGIKYHTYPTKLAIDQDSSIYIAGYSLADTLPQPQAGNPPNYYSKPYADSTYSDDYDGFFMKLTSDLQLNWVTGFATRGSETHDFVNSIASYGGNRLYYAGTVHPYPNNPDLNHQTIPYQDFSPSEIDYFQSENLYPNFTEGFMGCFDSLKLENTAGIKQLQQPIKDKLMVYPNPSNSAINILIPPAMENGRIDIFNLFGQTLFSQTNLTKEKITIDLSNFANGAYIIKVQNNKQYLTTKFIKQ